MKLPSQFSMLKYAVKQHIRVKCRLLLAHLEIMLPNAENKNEHLPVCYYPQIQGQRTACRAGSPNAGDAVEFSCIRQLLYKVSWIFKVSTSLCFSFSVGLFFVCLLERHRWLTFFLTEVCPKTTLASPKLLLSVWWNNVKTPLFRFCHFTIYDKFQLRSLLNYIYTLRKGGPGLPWWRSGCESACQCRGHGFEPWFGKIPHAAEQLGPWATNTEPARLEPVLRNRRGRDSERPAHRDEEWTPLAATRESPCTETKTEHSQK